MFFAKSLEDKSRNLQKKSKENRTNPLFPKSVDIPVGVLFVGLFC